MKFRKHFITDYKVGRKHWGEVIKRVKRRVEIEVRE